MGLSSLLAEQILSMFLTMIVGYIIVKIGLFKETDSKIISNMVVYICSPCVIIDAFQIESQNSAVLFPIGVNAPIPVITTLLSIK